jgi:2-polyprenyl-3-methyl-5-hydroxy-6-metoxy-1,4-benzoquinol methylase
VAMGDTYSLVAGCAHLEAVVRTLLDLWPEHEKFIQASFKDLTPESMRLADGLAEMAVVLMGDKVKDWAADYRWMCEMLMEERLYFARNKRYRRSTLAEAQEAVYSNAAFMSRYVNGLLFSQICWRNHAQAMDLFRTRFLPGNRAGYDHLEVGPGHGLFLVFAARDSRCGSVTAWDLSPSSMESTQSALRKMSVGREVILKMQDITRAHAPAEQFDSVMCSEVLEHTENPEQALVNMYSSLRPCGRIFLNIPVNSPAPDHIYLWRKSEDVFAMIADHQFVIDEFIQLPPTGRTLAQARKQDLDISCVTIAHKS